MTYSKRNNYFWISVILTATATFVPPLFADPQTTSEYRELTDFTAVKLTGSANTSIREGKDYEVEVNGPAELMDKAKTTVRNETLEIAFEGKNWLGNSDADDFHFTITMPRIDSIHLTGAGDIDVGPLVTKNLSISITGSGDITLESTTAKELVLSIAGSGNIEIDKLEAINASATISGSGNIEISGEVHRQAIKIMGSGNFNGKNLDAETASGSIMGSGDIEMGTVKKRSFQKRGSGSVRFANKEDTLSYDNTVRNPVGSTAPRGVM